MDTLQIQIMLGGPLVYVMVRYAQVMTNRENIWYLLAYALLVFFSNLYLMTDRFDIATSVYKAIMISAIYLTCVVFMGYVYRKDQQKTKTRVPTDQTAQKDADKVMNAAIGKRKLKLVTHMAVLALVFVAFMLSKSGLEVFGIVHAVAIVVAVIVVGILIYLHSDIQKQ